MNRVLAILIYAVLFGVSVPWYWHWIPAQGEQLVVGWPLWVIVSIGGSCLVSLHTAILLSHPWPAEEMGLDE